jgi:outer membrane cobalamin receptor
LETISFHSRFTKNFRQPTIRELYLPFPVANPDLRPETAFNWDAGTEVKLGFMRLNGAVYKTWATDMIKYFGMWPSAEVVNIDKLEIWGIEGECHVAQFGPFSAFITGCWQDVGRYTKQNPDGKINAKLNYGSQLKAGHLECELTSEWVHGLYMNNYHRDPMKNVFFIDGSIRLKTKRANGVEFEPYCLIRNILNVPYEYIQFYPMPGINILAGITIKV